MGLLVIGNQLSQAEIYHLDLKTTRRLALENNPDLVRSRMDLQSAEAAFAESRAKLFPSLTLDLTAPSYNESMSEEYVYQPSTNAYAWKWIRTGDYRYQGSLNLEQKLPTGGSFNISSLMYKRDYFHGSSKDSLITEYSSILRFSVEQPLLQPNPVRLDYQRSLLSLESAKLERQIRLRDLDYVIAIAYYSLVSADRRLHLEREDFERWRSSVTTAEDKFKAGLIPEVEVLKLRVELARRQGTLAITEGMYLDAANDLKLVLGLDLSDSLAVSSEVEKLEVSEGMIERAIAARQELRKTEIDLKNAELTYKQSKSSVGLNASIMAYYDFDSKQPHLEDLTDTFETDRGLSLIVSIPVYDWKAARKKVEVREISLRKTKYNLEQAKKEFEVELYGVKRTLEAVQSRLESARLAEQLAVKSYEITLSRFESGAVTATELIDAQISLNLARRELLDSIIEYNLTAVKYRILFFPEVTAESSL